jgi:hypothetical protein
MGFTRGLNSNSLADGVLKLMARLAAEQMALDQAWAFDWR